MKTVEKRKSDKCHQSFRQILDLLDLTDTTLENMCEKCSELPSQERMVTQILDQVLSDPAKGREGLPVNRPAYLCIFHEHNRMPVLTGDIYKSTRKGFKRIEADLHLDTGGWAEIPLDSLDVFTMNAPQDPLFLGSFQEKFHPQVRKIIDEPIRNCVGYHVHGDTPGLIIGMNYTSDVNRYDGEVMKSLSVTVSSLSTLAQQITAIKEGFVYLIESLSRAAEVNDENTGNHIVRVNTYAKHLCMAMKESETFCNEIGLVAQMHDVGKIHTPSEILRKPGPLTMAERKEMEKHTLQGEKILGNAPKLTMARNIACAHHENFDGSGYPRGLKGEEIPLEAAIVKIADVYDALRSERPYKKAMPHDEAVRVIMFSNGWIKPTHFNPAILDHFRKEARAFAEIYETLR
jgi:HD-GYP domain-containing protein (c-di-GMP phosphodiesterase class II)